MIQLPFQRYILTQEELMKYVVETQPETAERPNNISSAVPDGWTEDVKKFSISNVDNTLISKQLTEMEKATYYIIKEIRFFFSGTAQSDAYFHVSPLSTDGATRFIEGYYGEGSFCILAGNQNGKLQGVLKAKPYVFITAGTGGVSQTVYGSVRYYYR